MFVQRKTVNLMIIQLRIMRSNMKRIFYVDTENRKEDFWCQHLDKLDSNDLIILFGTIHSKPIHLPYLIKVVNSKYKFEYINVITGTPNALDFILVSYLTEKCVINKKLKHVIISMDTGYDVVVDHLRNKGFDVERRVLLYDGCNTEFYGSDGPEP